MSTLLHRLALFALLLLAGWPARAATLEVTPISHELPPGRNSLSMAVVNRGDAPVTVQVRAFDWQQDERQERLAPAAGVLVSPAIFTIAPGKSQTVRALFPDDEAPGPAGQERSHRLLIDELAAPGSAEPVRFALRLSVPVFRGAKAQRPPALAWQLDAEGKRLLARNDGGTRERVREVELRLSDGTRLAAAAPATPYVLPGARRSWPLAEADGRALRAGQTVMLSAHTDAGRIEVPLVVAP